MIIRSTDHDIEAIESRVCGYDYCIVGAGIVGIALAVSLAERGKRVVLLETGDWKEDPRLDDYYQGRAMSPHPPVREYRRQRLGGTSHLWGGRCIPLDAHDFEVRAHVPESGWPLSASDMAPFIQPANDILDAGQADYSIRSLRQKHQELIPGLSALAPDLAENIERYSLPTDTARKYRGVLESSTNILVVLRARVVDLRIEPVTGGVSTAIAMMGDSLRSFRVSAPEYVLCGGGIEVTRLMLCVRRTQPSWARFDASLGKYYGCHFDMTFGELELAGGRPRFSFERTADGVYARRKLQFSPRFQERYGLLNSAFRLHFQPYADARHGSAVLSLIYLLKSILPKEYQDILNHSRGVGEGDSRLLGHLANILHDVPAIPAFAWVWLTQIKLARRRLPYTLIAPRSGRYPLDFNSEQVPTPLNRIELADERDSQGIPRVSIQWRLTAGDIESGRACFNMLQKKIDAIGGARLHLNRDALETQLHAAHPIGGHHLGTTRMGHRVDHSVVDRHLRVHGTHNLRIASSSVFPTTGAANPTLSLLALALWAFSND